MNEQSTTGVEVKTGFFPLALLLLFCTPRIEIDGVVHKRKWGTHFFGLLPGKHTIRISFSYFFIPRCGANNADFEVAAGKIVRIKYWMPPLMLARGSLRIERQTTVEEDPDRRRHPNCPKQGDSPPGGLCQGSLPVSHH